MYFKEKYHVQIDDAYKIIQRILRLILELEW
jgi:hypothetical protein